LDFVVNSDPVIRFAILSGLGAVALTLLFILRIALLRAMYLRNERRKNEFLSIWRSLLNESALPSIDSGQLPVAWRLPGIAKKDIISFLSYWNHLQNSVRGESRARLNILARMTGMDHAIRQMLREGSNAEKLLAIVSLGYLGDKSDTEELKKLLASNQPIACFHAARALLRIDQSILRELMPVILQRSDLPTASIANILKEADPDLVSPVLSSMLRHAFLEEATPQYIIRLISLTVAAHPSVVHLSLRMIMEKTEDTEVLAACLKVMRSPDDLVKIRQFITHPNWRVRVQAVSALGDMGEKEDLDSLTHLLSDPQWWVRYRAAQAIANLPFVSTEDMEEIKKHLGDSFAIDMLSQVVSERML
jgi:hypothetical protein